MLFALFAEVERDLIAERTREGLAPGEALAPEARSPEGLAGRLTARRQGGPVLPRTHPWTPFPITSDNPS